MPTSQIDQVPKIIRLALALNPDSILDIGVGFGKYGFLCREYLEVWGKNDDYGKFTKRIDGIEIFPGYITPIHKYIYNKIYIGDVTDIYMKIKHNYNLILLVDVLEHLSKDSGKKLILHFLSKNSNIIVATPKDFTYQGGSFGNKSEIHLCRWNKDELSELSDTLFVEDRDQLVALLSNENLTQVRKAFNCLLKPPSKTRNILRIIKSRLKNNEK